MVVTYVIKGPVMTEDEIKPFHHKKVIVTLVDGYEIKGFISRGGYLGIEIIKYGLPSYIKNSHIENIREASTN